MVYHAIDQHKFLASKKIIRFMYIAKGLSKSNAMSVKMSILTTAGEYIEYSTSFCIKSITPAIASKLKSLFSEYLLIHESEVLIDKNVKKDDPICTYLQIVRHHVNFLMTCKSMDDILRRICKYHRGITANPLMKINKNYLNKVWKFLLMKKRCPWITQLLDYQIQKLKSRNRQRELMIMRVGIYYMFIKKKYRDINARVAQKKLQFEG